MKTLYIVRGVPGSGKSTFAKELVGESFLVCEADKYFIDKDGNYNFDATKLRAAHQWCKDQVETYMKDSQLNDQFYTKIAVSNTFTREWEMQAYVDLAAKYGYRVFSVIVENRHGGVNVHSVPDDVLEAMKERFEVKL